MTPPTAPDFPLHRDCRTNYSSGSFLFNKLSHRPPAALSHYEKTSNPQHVRHPRPAPIFLSRSPTSPKLFHCPPTKVFCASGFPNLRFISLRSTSGRIGVLWKALLACAPSQPARPDSITLTWRLPASFEAAKNGRWAHVLAGSEAVAPSLDKEE